ncbi:histone-fold-containing protein [Filobasidium floriforme]|uniref:histone-fold-containing protein n=1 Tax=Filobasidium floriforme TaxID=5210 RepID=UPI001E8DFBC4|nr:histone-fold-containing protein [Filobasidium floriforme]KAH8087949.1 histone-fold-containing protein [Filobasidium floriforme]
MSEPEETLPRATVQKIVKEILSNAENDPSTKEFTCAKETIDVLSTACVEFIKLIALSANDECEKDKKKTIAPEHVISAMDTIGMEQYKEDLTATWDASKEQAKAIQERQNKAFKTNGMSDAELAAAQEKLFAASLARYQGSDVKPE